MEQELIAAGPLEASVMPVAWADDSAANGGIGNCASAAAKRYWEASNWADRASANRLSHPLYLQSQIDAAVAAEREACAAVCDAYMRETGDMVARGCIVSVAADIRARHNV